MDEDQNKPKSEEPEAGVTQHEAAYQKHSQIIPKIKNEYENAYRNLICKLKEEQLEPLAKILLENESAIICREDLIKSMQQKLLQQLMHTTERFWVECGVDNSLITLEMLKEEFKDYEGFSWNILNKSPEERCRHLRIRFKQARIRSLQKQLEYQTKELESVSAENQRCRSKIHEITKSRSMCKRLLEDFLKDNEEKKKRLKQMQEAIWDILESS